MNLLIESIEGGNYLATLVEDGQSQLVRDKTSRPCTFHSLTEIREYFCQKSFDEVWLRQNTPYDEMCGQSQAPEALEMQLEWY